VKLAGRAAKFHLWLNIWDCHPGVACKRRTSVKSGAWLRRFDDITGVEESCVAKGIYRKKAKDKYFVIEN